MSPEQELKIDNLRQEIALINIERQQDRALKERLLASLARIDSHLQAIERAHAVPKLYSLRQACQVLSKTDRWGRDHPELLPAPVSSHPLRYRISDVEALAEHGLPKMGRKRNGST
jgi:hypothetical protein